MFLYQSAYLDQNLHCAGYPGHCIKCKKRSAGMRTMWIHISGGQNDNLGRLSSGIVTGWRSWCSGRWWRSSQRWRQLCSRRSASVGWRFTCFFASPACLQILCSGIVAMKASIHLILTKHGQVCFYRSLQLSMHLKHNATLPLSAEPSAKSPDQILRVLNCGVRKPAFGHIGHVQGEAHVGLFQLYPTSLPCHSSRHVENLQEIGCCSNNVIRLLRWPYTLP